MTLQTLVEVLNLSVIICYRKRTVTASLHTSDGDNLFTKKSSGALEVLFANGDSGTLACERLVEKVKGEGIYTRSDDRFSPPIGYAPNDLVLGSDLALLK